jgi:hypothetical protein
MRTAIRACFQTGRMSFAKAEGQKSSAPYAWISLMFDATGLDQEIKQGDIVTLIGEDGNEAISADELRGSSIRSVTKSSARYWNGSQEYIRIDSLSIICQSQYSLDIKSAFPIRKRTFFIENFIWQS